MRPLRISVFAALLLFSFTAAAQVSRFEVRLPSRTFTPPARIAPDLGTRIRGVMQAQRVDRVHVIVQLAKAPESSDRERLASQGLRLLSPINRLTWYASVTAASESTFRGARWAELIRPADKLSRLIPATPHPYQRRPNGRLAYLVLFHKDVQPEEVRQLAERLGAQLEEFDPRAFPVVRTATFVIPQASLASLTEADIVANIEPANPPAVDDNVASAQPLSRVNIVQAAPFGLTGTGINVGVWEAGDVIDTSSLDLAGRVTVAPNQVNGSDDHSSHVAGTIAASGVNVPNAEGMAPAATITSWDSQLDTAEMTNNAATIRLSNHSYGIPIGWGGGNFNNNQNLFGNYTNITQAWDNVVTGTGLIVMKSAGNDRDDGPGAPNQPFDCTQSNLGVPGDCIGQEATAKNVITVGAMNGQNAITGFSSFGPTDDGRIKPDVVAQGFNMLSLACNCFSDTNGNGDDVPDSTTATVVMGGTSMSTPVVTGVGALILEEAGRRNVTVTAEGMKALLIQTARDVAGVGQATVGPDFATGYGIVDAQNAVNLLRQGGLRQATLNGTGQGNAWTATLSVPPNLAELHVTLAWSDPAGTPGAPQILVNDLDLRLIAPDATTFTPWALNPAQPGNAAVRNGGNDATNNVEQVSVLTPMAGTWTVQVSSDAGNLPQAPQNFAVAGILPRSDIVLVMDRSGSMTVPTAEPGVTKIMALRSAANEFIDLLDLGGSATVGLVQFEENVVPFVPPFDLQPLAGNAGDAHDAIDNINAGGMTNIIGGVDAAIAQLSGAASPAPRQAIVVFSDGQHNRPIGSDLNSIGPSVQGGNYRFYSIGFGTDVDDAILSNIANASGGMHVNEQDLSPIQLTKHFLTVGALVHDLTVIADPTWELGAGESAQLPTTATTLDSSLIYAINWTGQKAKNIAVTLRAPGGERCTVPQKNHPGVEIRDGKWYRLIRVDLPYDCNGKRVHAGRWTIDVTPTEMTGSGKEKVDVMILGRSRLRLDSAVRFDKVRKQYVLSSFFTENGKRLRDLDGVTMTAEVLSPLPRTFDGERLDKNGKDDRPRPDTTRGKRIQQVRLRPSEQKDRLVTTLDAASLQPGLNQVRVIATVKRGTEEVRRESIVSVQVDK